jgi:hypothetical protein
MYSYPGRTYSPVIVCVCGVSMHDTPEKRVAHENRWHYREFPASYSSGEA